MWRILVHPPEFAVEYSVVGVGQTPLEAFYITV